MTHKLQLAILGSATFMLVKQWSCRFIKKPRNWSTGGTVFLLCGFPITEEWRETKEQIRRQKKQPQKEECAQQSGPVGPMSSNRLQKRKSYKSASGKGRKRGNEKQVGEVSISHLLNHRSTRSWARLKSLTHPGFTNWRLDTVQ